MPNISEFRKGRLAVGDLGTNAPTLARATINGTTGALSTIGTGGSGLVLINDSTSNTAAGFDFKADKVWNAVWNDVADFQKLDDQLIYGKCYFDTKTGAKICKEACQKSVIGIASDTFGFAVGSGNPLNQGKEVPIAVSGWTLAYVDQEYESGTVLTNTKDGSLTAMSFLQKLLFPERIVAIYKKPELAKEFGPDTGKIMVNGRHWVKVR